MATHIHELRSIILRQLIANGSVTRPELVSMTQCRAASVHQIVDELKSEGLVCEPVRTSKRTGRKAPPLTLDPDYAWHVGIDFQTERTIGVLVDTSGAVRHRVLLPASDRSEVSACRGDIQKVVGELRAQAGGMWSKVCGIGFADPGIVDAQTETSVRAVNIAGWANLATGAWLRETYGMPAGIWPECSVKTFMEYRQRIQSHVGSLFLLELGDGVGGGFIKNGQCFSGDNNLAMEIGHVVMDSAGPMCQCGNRGCLEALVGKVGIRRKVSEAIRSGAETVLDLEHFTLSEFTRCAEGDKVIQVIANDVCRHIGRALAIVVTLLNPSVIVLCGELTGLGDMLMDSVRMALSLNCFPGSVKNLKVEFSTLEADETARGAAILMRDKLLLQDSGTSPNAANGRGGSPAQAGLAAASAM